MIKSTCKMAMLITKKYSSISNKQNLMFINKTRYCHVIHIANTLSKYKLSRRAPS